MRMKTNLCLLWAQVLIIINPLSRVYKVPHLTLDVREVMKKEVILRVKVTLNILPVGEEVAHLSITGVALQLLINPDITPAGVKILPLLGLCQRIWIMHLGAMTL